MKIQKNRILLILLFFLFYATFNIYTNDEFLNVSLGTEGGTTYEKTSIDLSLDFTNKVFKFNNFVGINFTSDTFDFTTKTNYDLLDFRFFKSNIGATYHCLFLYDVAFEQDVFGTLNTRIGKFNSFFFLTDFIIGHKGTFIDSLPENERYLSQLHFGLNFSFNKIVNKNWMFNVGLKSYDTYRYPIPFNCIFYGEVMWLHANDYGAQFGLYARYTDLYSMTAYCDYVQIKLSFFYKLANLFKTKDTNIAYE